MKTKTSGDSQVKQQDQEAFGVSNRSTKTKSSVRFENFRTDEVRQIQIRSSQHWKLVK